MVFQRYRPKGRGLFQIGEFESFAQIYGCMGRTLQLALRDEQIIRKWTVFLQQTHVPIRVQLVLIHPFCHGVTGPIFHQHFERLKETYLLLGNPKKVRQTFKRKGFRGHTLMWTYQHSHANYLRSFSFMGVPCATIAISACEGIKGLFWEWTVFWGSPARTPVGWFTENMDFFHSNQNVASQDTGSTFSLGTGRTAESTRIH